MKIGKNRRSGEVRQQRWRHNPLKIKSMSKNNYSNNNNHNNNLVSAIKPGLKLLVSNR